MKKAKDLDEWFNNAGAHAFVVRPQFTEEYFAPYAAAIGQLLLAWNDLHERLGTLFATLLGEDSIGRSLILWHSVRNDIGKRRLLRATLGTLSEEERSKRPQLVEEAEWILDRADKLEGMRDDSAHTPLLFTTLDFLSTPDVLSVPDILESRVTPHAGFHNPRALRMTEKDLLIEYEYARGRMTTLRDYVIAIDAAWSNAPLPWPGRPHLPERKPR